MSLIGAGVPTLTRRSGFILAAKGVAALAAPSIITGQARAGDVEPVERHVVLVVDLSNSVVAQEYEIMMRGFGSALLSNDAKIYFSSGAVYALSTIFFATGCIHSSTRIVTNFEQAQNYVQNEFFDPDTNVIRQRPQGIGTQTSISSAMNMAINLFDNEHEYRFEATHRALIVAGDGVNNEGSGNIPDLVKKIAEQFNGVVYGIPIIDPNLHAVTAVAQANASLVNYFRDSVATPEGLRCACDGSNLLVRTGEIFPAEGFAQVEPAVLAALRGIQL